MILVSVDWFGQYLSSKLMDSAAADLTSGVGSFSNIIRAGIYTNNGCQINSITQSRVNQ